MNYNKPLWDSDGKREKGKKGEAKFMIWGVYQEESKEEEVARKGVLQHCQKRKDLYRVSMSLWILCLGMDLGFGMMICWVIRRRCWVVRVRWWGKTCFTLTVKKWKQLTQTIGSFLFFAVSSLFCFYFIFFLLIYTIIFLETFFNWDLKVTYNQKLVTVYLFYL